MTSCKMFPSDSMDEKYELLLKTDGSESNSSLIAQSVWGVLRGLETFSQIVVPINGNRFAVRTTSIVDFPRFPHRGLLIDTSRHYLPVKTIMNILEAMSYSKLNVLHWHIVDDQSFPFQSNTFPDLSDKGSYDRYRAIYSQVDVRRVIEHARLRGIRVIPEFDSPGHTLSWGKGIPGLLTQCNHSYPQPYGPIDPTNENNYVILRRLFKEIHEVFPDKYLHLGGDEVDFGCWKSNENISKYMEINNISSYEQLDAYYIDRLLNITNEIKAKAIVWEEVFDNNVPLRKDTIIQVWRYANHPELYYKKLFNVTDDGYPALLSGCWYLDSLANGGDWEKFYKCDPLAFNGTEEQKRLVLGGEACMWGEVVDETNVQQRIWPRACAAAEVLWSGNGSTFADAAERIEEHVCRLKKRGIPAQPPNGPAFCPYTVM
ncbi:beta-hexosaminidase subunit beta-like isoform X2 [Planococcus citri]